MKSSAAWARAGALPLLGAALIAAGAQVRWTPALALLGRAPAPFTLQTLAVLGMAGVHGRSAVAAALLYLLGVLCGLPILAGGAAAPGGAFLALRSAGYVIGFVPAALLVAQGLGRGGRAVGFAQALGWQALGHLVVLLCGAGWLWHQGAPSALAAQGALLPGALLKSLLGAGLCWAARRPALAR